MILQLIHVTESVENHALPGLTTSNNLEAGGYDAHFYKQKQFYTILTTYCTSSKMSSSIKMKQV